MIMIPDLKTLARTIQGFSFCDALLEPDWDLRYFSYDAGWNSAKREAMGSVRNGHGLEIFFLFSNGFAIGKIFDGAGCNVSMDIIQSLPETFESFKSEPAFGLNEVTFLAWSTSADENWSFFPSKATLPDVFSVFSGGIEAYHQWAEDYYGRKIDKTALFQAFYTLEIDQETLQKLETVLSLAEIQEELKTILG